MGEFFYPAKEVLPNLWVGSAGDASNSQFMKRHTIDIVVNCSRDIPFSFPTAVECVRVAVHDHPSENLVFLRRLPEVMKIIDKHMIAGGSVLIHCYAGISRSSTVAAAYLMYRHAMCKKDAIAWIKSRKPEAFEPRVVFDQALSLYAYIKNYKS